MGASNADGPFYTYGNMAAVQAGTFGFAVPDPNTDAGPNGEFQGDGLLDCRYLFQKDQVVGRTGMVPIHFSMAYLRSAGQIPAALSATNIAAAANVVSGTAMTLAAASVGVAANIPIIPFSANINGGTVTTAALALDFGFAFGNCTSGTLQITVADSTVFSVGMPLVIAGVGNAGGTVPLLTNVATIVDATHITLANAPLATNSTAPIGTGNIWGPSVTWSTPANMLPTAALPWLAGGPGLFLDPRQAITRGVQITGVSGGAGGTFTVRGWDIYNMPMSQTITVASGANTVYSLKCFKYIQSVTPNFSDAHNYSVGTSDVFGLHYFGQNWDDLDITWANAFMNSNTGFVNGVTTSPATALTGDVRGTIQVSASGGGSGIGASASNGTISSLAMSGRRLTMSQMIPPHLALAAFPSAPQSLFGQTQA